MFFFFFSSRRRHTRFSRDWSSDVCSSDLVGTAGSYAFRLTVPGGELPAAGVTWVGVVPSHRRRGILTEFMRRQLEDTRDRGEPLAVLFASESAIYGRFGYGIAAPTVSLRAEKAR